VSPEGAGSRGSHQPPRGVVELPVDGASERSPLRIAGWAGDDHGIVAVRVIVDGKLAAVASFVALRPDVTKAFPQLRHGTDRHGWEALVDAGGNGPHIVHVIAVDTDGATTDLGTRSVTVADLHSHSH
jgi:hypothetical protein